MCNVTVVVCTYNRAALLREAIESLRRQTTGGRFEFEILVVDNASTDTTPAVMAEVTQTNTPVIRSVCEGRQGVSHARNRGIAEARGEWIAFFDDDQEAAPEWLQQLLKTAEQHNCRVVGGKVQLAIEHDVKKSLGPTARSLFGATVGRNQAQPYTRKFAPGTGNLLIHRSVFESIGIFDVHLVEAGEDTDLYRRMRQAGIEAWFTPEAVVYHKIPADRLQRDHLLRTAQRIGGHIARRERKSYGTAAFMLILAARMLQACVRDVIAWGWSRCTGDQAARLDADCSVARAVGYLRNGLRELAPNLFEQPAYFSHLNFRSERQSMPGSSH